MSLVECRSIPTGNAIGLRCSKTLFFIQQTVATLANWHRNREAINHLETLDDRLLQDMGITRSQIHAAVNGTLYYPHKS